MDVFPIFFRDWHNCVYHYFLLRDDIHIYVYRFKLDKFKLIKNLRLNGHTSFEFQTRNYITCFGHICNHPHLLLLILCGENKLSSRNLDQNMLRNKALCFGKKLQKNIDLVRQVHTGFVGASTHFAVI